LLPVFSGIAAISKDSTKPRVPEAKLIILTGGPIRHVPQGTVTKENGPKEDLSNAPNS